MNYGMGDDNELDAMGGIFDGFTKGMTTILTAPVKMATELTKNIGQIGAGKIADLKMKAARQAADFAKMKKGFQIKPAKPKKPATIPTGSVQPPATGGMITGAIPAAPAAKESIQQMVVRYAPYAALAAGSLILLNIMTGGTRSNPCHRRRYR